MDQLVSVVLADGHDLFVEGLSVLLDAESDLRVVALARDARQVVEALRAHQPDVVVVDAHLPAGGIQEILASAAAGATRVLALAEEWTPESADWLERGADAVVTKQLSARQLAHCIRALSSGQAPPAPPPAPSRRQPQRRDGYVDLIMHSLSQREREVLSLLVSGYSNRRIAEECVLSLNTVRAHVQNVLIKLGVHSRLEAASFAIRRGGLPSG